MSAVEKEGCQCPASVVTVLVCRGLFLEGFTSIQSWKLAYVRKKINLPQPDKDFGLRYYIV